MLQIKWLSYWFVLAFLASISYAEIHVACAANMQYAMNEIIDLYQKETGYKVTPVFASSGKLSAQIMNGAPFDVLVATNMAYGDSLFVKGFALAKPRTYASGVLVLWSLRPDLDWKQGLGVLNDPRVKTIAIGDLKLTVYGPAAQQAMQKAGVYQALKPKLVFGENINTVAQYIVNQSVDVGFSNLSYNLQGPMAGKGKWMEVDSMLYDPLPQGASLLRYGIENHPQESKQFYEFLFGEKTRAILKKNGYSLP